MAIRCARRDFFFFLVISSLLAKLDWDTMSGTLLHSAIAAGAGLAIGISATLALSKPKKESPAAPPPSAAGPGSSGVPPTAFPRPNGIPTVYNGGLTTLGSPLIQPSSIGSFALPE